MAPITTTDLTSILNQVYDFSLRIDGDTMRAIYGDHMGNWLWNKYYVFYHHDFLMWYGYLDLENRAKLIAYLTDNEINH